MKQEITLFAIFLLFVSCKAQTLPLFNPSDDFDTNNAYYKDLDGDLTKLVGTWEYTSGSESLIIKLKKVDFDFVDLNPERNLSYYEDVLFGEYQYIDSDGIEIINTLNNIDDYSDVSEHLIYGNYIKSKTDFPVCEDCSTNERRVWLLINDPERDYFTYEMEIRFITAKDSESNEKQLRIFIKPGHLSSYPENKPGNHRIPVCQEKKLNKI